MSDDYEMVQKLQDMGLSSANGSGSIIRQYMSNDQRIHILCKMLGISTQGRDWLVAAIDPFHDTAIECRGLPDGSNALSVVLNVNLTMTISAPAGVSGAWDCSIVDFPTMTSGTKNGYLQWSSYATASNGPYGLLGSTSIAVPSPTGLSYISGPTGAPLDWTVVLSTYSNGSLTLPSTYGQSNYRIIYKGFEVVNATNIINQSGSVFLWTQSVPDIKTASSYLAVNSGIGSIGTTSAALTASPPNTSATAQILPNSSMMLASKGCYVPGRLSAMDIPTSSNTTSQYMYYQSTPNVGPFILPAPNFAGGSYNVLYLPPANQQNFNLTGAYFTGLANSTILTVRYKLGLEQFPSNADALVSTAKPSPALDDKAFQLYNHMVSHMPVGCGVSDNFIGSWFKKAVSSIQGVGRSIGDAASNIPVLKTVMNIPKRAAQVANGLDKYIQQKVDKIEKGEVEAVASDVAKLAPAIRTARALQSLTSGKTDRKSVV